MCFIPGNPQRRLYDGIKPNETKEIQSRELHTDFGITSLSRTPDKSEMSTSERLSKSADSADVEGASADSASVLETVVCDSPNRPACTRPSRKISPRKRNSAAKIARSYKSGTRNPGAQCPSFSRTSRVYNNCFARAAYRERGGRVRNSASGNMAFSIRVRATWVVPNVAFLSGLDSQFLLTHRYNGADLLPSPRGLVVSNVLRLVTAV